MYTCVIQMYIIVKMVRLIRRFSHRFSLHSLFISSTWLTVTHGVPNYKRDSENLQSRTQKTDDLELDR